MAKDKDKKAPAAVPETAAPAAEALAAPPAPTVAVTDPLEASKIATKPEVVVPVKVEEAPPPLAMPSGEVEPAKPPVKKFSVVQDTTISLNGQFVKLNKGDIVSEASYGPLGMQRIMESNVALTELKDG